MKRGRLWLNQVSTELGEGQTKPRLNHGFFIALSSLTPADKHSHRHAFINSPSICYLADVAAIAEAVKVSNSFAHKTCKNSSPQIHEIPVCQN
jgi:hypothetical protein